MFQRKGVSWIKFCHTNWNALCNQAFVGDIQFTDSWHQHWYSNFISFIFKLIWIKSQSNVYVVSVIASHKICPPLYFYIYISQFQLYCTFFLVLSITIIWSLQFQRKPYSEEKPFDFLHIIIIIIFIYIGIQYKQYIRKELLLVVVLGTHSERPPPFYTNRYNFYS